MERFDALHPLLAQAATPPVNDDGRVIGLVASLREACRDVDDLWRAAIREGSDDMAVQLGEASHAIHRAFIALGALAYRGATN